MILAFIYLFFALFLLILFLPVIFFQLYLLKKNMTVLKKPAGLREGTIPGREPAIELLVIGDSTVAGLGVSDYGDSLPVQIAIALELYSKRKINWRSYGKPGIRTGQMIDLLPGYLPKTNLVIFVSGVNDAISFNFFWQYRQRMKELIDSASARFHAADIVVCGIPPLEKFPAFYFPLSFVMGLWSRSLDAVTNSAAKKKKSAWFIKSPVPKARHFAIDGFHPGRRGYAQWGEYLGRAITIRLKLRLPQKS